MVKSNPDLINPVEGHREEAVGFQAGGVSFTMSDRDAVVSPNVCLKLTTSLGCSLRIGISVWPQLAPAGSHLH